jgi:hypothetical protein
MFGILRILEILDSFLTKLKKNNQNFPNKINHRILLTAKVFICPTQSYVTTPTGVYKIAMDIYASSFGRQSIY